MKRQLALITLSATLMTGCATFNQSGNQYFTVNLDSGELCVGEDGNCRALRLISPSFHEVDIAKAYNLELENLPSWNAETLAALLIKPPKGQYQATQIDARHYQIPATDEVWTAWRVLDHEAYSLYNSKYGRGFSFSF